MQQDWEDWQRSIGLAHRYCKTCATSSTRPKTDFLTNPALFFPAVARATIEDAFQKHCHQHHARGGEADTLNNLRKELVGQNKGPLSMAWTTDAEGLLRVWNERYSVDQNTGLQRQ